MTLETKLNKIDELREFVSAHSLPPSLQRDIAEDFKLRYTYDSNAIEGNTLTLHETKVVLEGVTIGGKTLREHLEVINHAEAIEYIMDLVKNSVPISEYQIKSIHNLILKGIDDRNAGVYRSVDVRISGAKHIPPQPYLIQNKMDRFIQWYEGEAQGLHPVIRASRVHIDLVGVHPFIDGNGRTSRLVMNLELLKNNYPAINIKSDKKAQYYAALESAHCDRSFEAFDELVAGYVMRELQDRKNLYMRSMETKPKLRRKQ